MSMVSKKRPLICIILLGAGIFILLNSGIEAKQREENLLSMGKEFTEKINWFNYNEGLEKAFKEKKHIMILFYADWCYYCKMMDNKTFANLSIIESLKEGFVPIKVNADRERKLVSRYKITGFPSTLFLEHNAVPIQLFPGYMPPDMFIKALKYIKENNYNTMKYKEYINK
ncbi:MAG: thioredoxin family protein [Thermodesulfobacteriota bacterium]|nr:thioredoxin family protein [Thermodesulfobacteriota bacterium]